MNTLEKVPYQRNEYGFIALLPAGNVEFLHVSIEPYLKAINQGDIAVDSVPFKDYIMEDPLVNLNNFHLSGPLIAFIEITNLCNLKCKHCYAFSGPKRDNEMSTHDIFRLLDELEEIGCIQVFLTGGEVFAHKDALSIINYASKKPFILQIFTNGLLITEEKLAKIEDKVAFIISFDTADPTRTIRGKMDFPKLRKRFEWMKKYGHSFRTAISVHNNNIHDAKDIFDWCIEHNYPRPQWLETHPIGRAMIHQNIILQPEKLDEVFAIYKECMDLYSEEDNVEEELDDMEGVKFKSIETIKFCQRLERATGFEKCGRSVVYINSNGEVFPCSNCMSNNMYGAGNITNDSFKRIWREEFRDIRSISFSQYESCNECAVYQNGVWCQFRCPPLAKNVSGDELGCGATEYLRQFMLKSNAYWGNRKRNNIRLKLQKNVTI